MNQIIVVVDSNKRDLRELIKYIYLLKPNSRVIMFLKTEEAAKYVKTNPIDLLVTEINMKGMTGFGLQSELQKVQPSVPTIFVAESDAYCIQAIKTRTAGYIVKPVTREKIRESFQEIKRKDEMYEEE